MTPIRMFCLTSAFAALSAFAPPAFSQTSGDMIPEVTFCDPLMSRDLTQEYEDDEDDEFEEVYRYDLERSEKVSDREAIVGLLFEERWNFETGQLNPRYELCESRPSYVVHWTQMYGSDEDGTILLDAEGLLSIKRDGSFEYVFSDRSYRGTWQLDGAEIVLQAPWMNENEPIRSAVEKVQTPVEITFEDGRTDTYVEENIRLGWFRLLRISTTEKGKIRKCECQDQ